MSSTHVTSAGCLGQPVSGLLQVERRDSGSGNSLGVDSRRDAPGPVLLGESAAVRLLRSQIERVAPYFRIALIRGEMGCGKESAAWAMHTL